MTMASSQILSSLLRQWLSRYNVRMAHCVARFLDVKGESHGLLKKSITLVTPSGEFVKIVIIDPTTRVSEIVPLGYCVCRMGQFDVALEGLVWDLGGELVVHPKSFQGICVHTTQFPGYCLAMPNRVQPVVAVVNDKRQLHLWNTETNDIRHQVRRFNRSHRTALRWSPCGQFISLISVGHLTIYEITHFTRVFHRDNCRDCDWSLTGSQFAIAFENGLLSIFSTSTFKRLQTLWDLRKLEGYPDCIEVSQVIWVDESTVAVTTYFHDLIIWETSTGNYTRTISAPRGYRMFQLQWHPSTRQLFVGYNPSEFATTQGMAPLVHIWEIKTWTQQPSLEIGEDTLIPSNLDPNNQYYITNQNVWDVDTRTSFLMHPSMCCARWNSCGSILAVGETTSVSVYNIHTRTLLATLSNQQLLHWNRKGLITQLVSQSHKDTLNVWK